MLTNLRIQNFKSWRDTGHIRFAPLTGFWGPNSSGKSSILQFLLMLKQTAEARDFSQVLNLGSEQNAYVDLGRFSEAVLSYANSPSLSFEIGWIPDGLVYHDLLGTKTASPKVPAELLTPFGVAKQHQLAPLQVSAQIRSVDDLLILERLCFAFEATLPFWANIEWKGVSESGSGYNYHFEFEYAMNDSSSRSDRYDATLSSMNLFVMWLWELRHSAWSRKSWKPIAAGSEDNDSSIAVEKMRSIQQSLSAFIGGIAYLGPLREYPNRLYLWRGSRIGNIGVKGEQAVQALLSTRFTHPGNGSVSYEPIEQVAAWLEQLGLVHSFEIQPIAEGRREYEVLVRQIAGAPPVLLTNVGFGVSQVLPVLTLCALAEEGSTLILEQPEIHLHPAVQAGLADVFIDVIKNRDIQIILESHSEHLLARLQRRMAEEKLTPDDVALYFTHIEDGASKLEELEIDSYGNISNWPQDFFGDIMGDMVAMTDAAARRQSDQNKSTVTPTNGAIDA